MVGLYIADYSTSGSYSRRIKGVKGLNLPSILEETRVLDTYLEILVYYTCFS